VKNRTWSAGVALVAVLALASCAGAPASKEDAGAADVWRVATEGTFAPFNYYDESNTLTGFEVELAEALAADIGVTLEWEAASFDSLLVGLRQDRYDFVIASHSITPERREQVDFANPHYCSGGILTAPEGAAAPRKDSLQNSVVAAQVGATYLDLVTEETNAKQVDSYPSDAAGLDAMLRGQADVWVADRFVVAESEKARSVKLVKGDSIAVEEIGMAVKKGRTDIVDKLNAALERAQEDGTYEKISTKWFDEDIRCLS